MDKFYFSKSKIRQTFETLSGLIEGVSADGEIAEKEVYALRRWISEHDQIAVRQPFKELVNIIKEALADNKITESELKDIRFVCNRTLESFQRDDVKPTSAIQRLHGIASGISSDGELRPVEWDYLSAWIKANSILKGSWPYDEIESLVLKHRKLEIMTRVEFEVILHYLNDFCGFNSNAALTHPLSEPGIAITGITAVCPDVSIPGKTFCLTGESKKFPREKIRRMISDRGGINKDEVSTKVDYLIVGADGSPMWTYSCYGRKVEDAVSLRKTGHRILIVHEFDFWDHLADAA